MNPKTPRRLHDQADTIATLTAMLGAFPDLPAANIHVQRSGVIGDLRVHVHGDPAGFEHWREALRMDPSTVDMIPGTDYASLEAEGDWLGLRVALIGYVDLRTDQDTQAVAA